MPIDLNQAQFKSSPRFERSPHAVFTELDGEVALFQSETCEYLILNETGSFIWHKLSDFPTLEELCASLISDYEVSLESCIDDVRDWLEIAIKQNVVLQVDGEVVAPS